MRPSDLPSAERWPHGVRSRYVSGCRCNLCKEANRQFYHTRVRAKMRGDWNGLVNAEPARRHLLRLSHQDIGRRSVRAACDVSDTVLADIRSGRKKQIRARTEKKILAVNTDAIADHSFVSAKESWKLINELLREGYTKAELARRLGFKAPALQLKKDRVLAKSAQRVRKLHKKIMEEVALKKETKHFCTKCGHSHSKKNRLAFLKRRLPNEIENLKELWSCTYGGIAGERMLYRDLNLLRAEAADGIWRLTISE